MIIKNAVNTLLSIDTDNLSDSQFVEYSFLMSQSQIALSNPESAEEQLNQSRFIFLSSEFTKSDQLRLSEIYAELHFARGNHYQGFEALIDLTKASNVNQIFAVFTIRSGSVFLIYPTLN